MPSSKDPLATVNPGPGKLPAGVASASSLLFTGGGGSGAGLLAHITDPVDAHMASAIGVNPINPASGLPVLLSAGGVVDGESVLDFIVQAKDLFPDRPNFLGADGMPNPGIPNWDTLDAPPGGAWTNGTAAVFSHFILSAFLGLPTGYEAVTYPADRGVLAVYRSTDGDYLNPGTTTLYAALWLGSTANQPVALTCPSADFQESLRETLQPVYAASNVGLDQITLDDRLGYRKNYVVTGTGYDDYTANFNAYQIALHVINFPAAVNGSNDSWLIVHWKESYAITDAAIAPAALAGNLITANCYSAVPGNFDAVPVNSAGVQAINRRYVFRDSLSSTIPSVASWTAALIGVPSTVYLSGVRHYNNAAALSWNSDLRVNDLVGNAWLPGKVAGGQLPADFVSTLDPIEYDFTDFGGSPLGRAYYQLRQTGAGSTYTMAAAPLPAHQVQDLNPVLAVAGPLVSHTPAGPGFYGIARLRVSMNRPYTSDNDAQTTRWMFNSWPQTGGGTSSTATFEPFRDEKYRYDTLFAPVPTMQVLPVGPGVKYDSTVALAVAAPLGALQVVGDILMYPTLDFSTYQPGGNPDYSAVFGADPGNAYRSYIRAFDTGIARQTGRIRIRGLVWNDIKATTAFTLDLISGHPGGAAISIAVPGVNAGLDLGRPLGSPDLNMAASLRGCMVSYLMDGPDLIVTYDTGAPTQNNGSGEYPLVVGIFFTKTAGSALEIEEIEWLPPL